MLVVLYKEDIYIKTVFLSMYEFIVLTSDIDAGTLLAYLSMLTNGIVSSATPSPIAQTSLELYNTLHLLMFLADKYQYLNHRHFLIFVPTGQDHTSTR